MSATAPDRRVSVPSPAAAVTTWLRHTAVFATPCPTAMTKLFNYNVITLIELVQTRPCLWDKTCVLFKDRRERQKAWEEIYAVLEKDYHKKDKKERRRIAELVTSKWHNVRDAFVKSLKKMYGHPSRRYLYHDKLQFLTKVVRRDDHKDEIEDSRGDSCGRKRARLQDDIDQEILKALRCTKSEPDEDEAFFISLTPSVRNMRPENKLEFRMGVLQLIKKINEREANYSVSSPGYISPKSEQLDQESAADFK